MDDSGLTNQISMKRFKIAAWSRGGILIWLFVALIISLIEIVPDGSRILCSRLFGEADEGASFVVLSGNGGVADGAVKCLKEIVGARTDIVLGESFYKMVLSLALRVLPSNSSPRRRSYHFA